jgi:hypothetical protein
MNDLAEVRHAGAALQRPVKAQVLGSGSRAGVNPEDEAWEAGLPRGLTVDKCAGLPQSASVQQLMEVRGRTRAQLSLVIVSPVVSLARQ